ncbi:MAG: hypothetical protein ACPGC1_04460 [Pseudomonadales bacterium]
MNDNAAVLPGGKDIQHAVEDAVNGGAVARATPVFPARRRIRAAGFSLRGIYGFV